MIFRYYRCDLTHSKTHWSTIARFMSVDLISQQPEATRASPPGNSTCPALVSDQTDLPSKRSLEHPQTIGIQPDFTRSAKGRSFTHELHLRSTVAAELADNRITGFRVAVSVALQRTFGIIDCDFGPVKHMED